MPQTLSMSSLKILVLVLCQVIASCSGSTTHQITDRSDLTKHVQGKRLLPSAVTDRVESRSFLDCCMLCHASEGCRGVAYTEEGCWFIDVAMAASEIFDGECSTCSYSVMMQTFSPDPSDCKSLLKQAHTDDRVYTINPSASAPFQAFCDMTNGGWTVIQRRVDDSVDFYRGLVDYVAGFGDPSGNFSVGLDNIHALTLFENTELFVTMDTFEGESAEAYYSSFYVDDAASGYRLSVGGYSGTAGDSMAQHNGKRFTTYDNDFDSVAEFNCAARYVGAWWYRSCHDTNPNGLYLLGANSEGPKGIVWQTFKGDFYSLKSIEFKVRRIF